MLVAIRQNDAAGKECGRPYFPKFPILDDPTWKQMTFQFMTDAQASTVSLAVHPHEPPVTLWLDDFSLTPVTEPRGEPMLGKVEREPGGTLVHVGRAAGLVLQSRYQAQRDHIAIDAELSAADPGDRAVVLAFALPIQASGWTWWDDLETPKEVAGGERYGKLQAAGNGAMMSSYPFCALARTGIGGLSLANRMEEPRIFRLTCSAQSGLAMAYDLGLSEATRKFPRRARVRFVLYAHDPAWGFRSAADKYYRIVPQAFQARLQVHGNWFVGGVDDGRFPEDFEPGYMQAGAQPKPYLLNKRHGFLSERNSIPWFWFHTVVTSDPATQTMPRPRYEDALKKIEEDTNAAENVGAYHAYYIRLRDMARACLNCGIHDAHGRLVSNAWQTWNRGKSWMEHWQLNTDPDLPSPSRAELWTRDEFEKEVERAGMLAGRVDGAHFDSLDGLRLNFRREHFACVDIPLTFDYQTRRVAQLQAFHHVEFLRYVSSRLWPRGLSVSANQWGTWMLYAPCLDWLGAEAQISLGGGAEMRTLAYQKPVSYINEDEFWHKSPEHMRADVEHYMLYA
ncbi:MAG: hypothetical protein FJ272_20335, partial [Planctomycetes bacterium]|nr:hypothetical protein [Planctomycetota bacterium]